MSNSSAARSPNAPVLTNGPAAAAILSAGIGCFALAVLAFAGDKSSVMKSWFAFYKPTGPLSGVTTSAILIWIFTWGVLNWRWRKSTVAAGRVSAIALALLALSLLLTFPPFVDFL